MQADAYRRARRLLTSRRDYMIARVLGFFESFLIVALLGVIALFVALVSSRGEARFPASRRSLLPSWVVNRVTGEDQQYLLFDDTGFFPLIANNLRSTNPVHRGGASALGWIIRKVPAFQYNGSALTTLVALGAFCIVMIVLLAIWRRRVVARVATEVATSFRRQIHRQMYRLGQSTLPTEGIGPIVNLWTREVNDVRDGLITDLDLTPRIHVLAFGLLVLALLVSPLLTTFLASLGLLVWLMARIMSSDAKAAGETALRDASVQLCLLHEDLGLLRTVRTFGVGEYDRQRFDEHLDRYSRADMRRIVTTAPIKPSTVLLYGAGLTLALGLLGYNVVVSDQISIATMLILLVSLGGLAYPITQRLRLGKAIQQANRSTRGISEFLERRPELHQNVGAHFLNSLKEQIVFENVALESRSGRRLLEGVSAEIPAGSRTAIMGHDDDSKLALVCLIPRLLDPRTGRVLIDGHDLRDVTFDSVRAQVATVLQADLVFTDSVLVNIGLGDAMNTLPRVIEAAKVAHAHHFIQDLPHGYDTIIGPLGHYLKPDEQFRIALARAYLHDPSILIVEEPKVPFDDDTKHFIDDTLVRLAVGRTLIILPHRLATFRSCDHVIVLENGRVDESGTPSQVAADSKLLRHLLYVEFNEYASGEMEAGQMQYAEPVPKGTA